MASPAFSAINSRSIFDSRKRCSSFSMSADVTVFRRAPPGFPLRNMKAPSAPTTDARCRFKSARCRRGHAVNIAHLYRTILAFRGAEAQEIEFGFLCRAKVQ
jgi:hypothetical protein